MKTRSLKRPRSPNRDTEREVTADGREFSAADSDDAERDNDDGTSTPPARKILKRLLTQEVQKALHDLEDDIPAFSRTKHHRAASLIPEFDPESEDCTVRSWLNKIDQLGAIHGWDEKTKSFHLQDKLRGQARKWYNRLEEYDYSWEEWRNMLLRAFPKHRDYANLLEEMLNRKKMTNENMTKYYQEKTALCYRCKLSNAAAVSCIIRGLPPALQSNARAFQCDRPEELYEGFLSALDDYRSPHLVVETPRTSKDIARPEILKRIPVNVETDPCPRCKKTGHMVRNCSLPDQRTCFKCGAQGHISPRCPENNKDRNKVTNNSVKEVRLIQNYNNIYTKTAKCNGVYVKSYVDTGSEVNVLSAEIAELLNLEVKPSYVALKGFNGGSVKSNGEVQFNLQIDELDLHCTAHLTNIEMNGINLLVGQPVINSNGVSLIVQNGTAAFKIVEPDVLTRMDVAEENHHFKVTTAFKERLPPGTSIIKVYMIGNRGDNDVVTPARHFDLHGVTYSLPATLLRGSEGYLKVVNTGSKDVEWSEGTVLVRAESCEEASIPQFCSKWFPQSSSLGCPRAKIKENYTQKCAKISIRDDLVARASLCQTYSALKDIEIDSLSERSLGVESPARQDLSEPSPHLSVADINKDILEIDQFLLDGTMFHDATLNCENFQDLRLWCSASPPEHVATEPIKATEESAGIVTSPTLYPPHGQERGVHVLSTAPEPSEHIAVTPHDASTAAGRQDAVFSYGPSDISIVDKELSLEDELFDISNLPIVFDPRWDPTVGEQPARDHAEWANILDNEILKSYSMQRDTTATPSVKTDSLVEVIAWSPTAPTYTEAMPAFTPHLTDAPVYILNEASSSIKIESNILLPFTSNHLYRSKGNRDLHLDLRSAPLGDSDPVIGTPDLLSCVEQLEAEKCGLNELHQHISAKVDHPQSSASETTAEATHTDTNFPTSPVTLQRLKHEPADSDEDYYDPGPAPRRARRSRRRSSDSDESYTPQAEPAPARRGRKRKAAPVPVEVKQVRRGRPPKRRESVASSVHTDDNTSCVSFEDVRYRELRDKNNEASKRSRMNRKQKEQSMEALADRLEERNKKLKVKADILEDMTKRLKDALMMAILQK